MSSGSPRSSPFPGLRPFEEADDDLFFGRDSQITDLLSRLRRRRFIAVVGTSGSGKSSLVRAGVLPALHGGFMAGAGSRWFVATLRPGTSPILNLARALDAAGVLGDTDAPGDVRIGLAQAALDRGRLGLVELLDQAGDRRGQHVLVVVDQFEEIFRFQQESPNEAAGFINLLLSAVASGDVYVIVTMRSDFLGECAQFHGLPEAVNDGLYLVPRMSWDQLRHVIEGPVLVAGARIEPSLITRLLNDLGDNPDQLPVLQHALMRTWNLKPEDGQPVVLTLEDYARTGGLEHALSLHADAVYASLDERRRVVAEKLFKSLTELGSDNRGIRRPTGLGEICAITNASFDDVCSVIEAFRAPECSFLTPSSGVLTDRTVIDIAHEGLMRIWPRLASWVDEEAQSTQQFRRLATAASLHAAGRAALWRDPDLRYARTWRASATPTAAWAHNVDPKLDYDRALGFLDRSFYRSLAGSFAAVALLAAGALYFVFFLSIRTVPIHIVPIGPFSTHARTVSIRVDAPRLSVVQLNLDDHPVGAARVGTANDHVSFGPIDVDALRTLHFSANASLWYAAIVSTSSDRLDVVNPEPRTMPLVLEPPRLTAGAVTVFGRAPPNVNVIIWDARAGNRPAEVLARVQTDRNGHFAAVGFLDPGTHLISATLPRCTSPQCAAPAVPLWVPAASAGERQLSSRDLSLSIQYQQLSATFTVTLPRSDPAVQALQRAQSALPAFVATVFPLSLVSSIGSASGEKSFDSLFVSTRPTLHMKDGYVTVQAASGYQEPGGSILPPWSGILWLDPQTPAASSTRFHWVHDRLQIDVADYVAGAPGPLPVQTIGTSYVWERPYDPDGEPVRISLQYAPLMSTDALRRGLQSSPYPFFPHYIARFLAFTHGFSYALPMFAYLVLCGGRRRLVPAARILLTCAVASDVWLACVSSQPDVNIELPIIAPWLNRFESAAIVSGLLSPIMCGLGLAAIAGTLQVGSRALSGGLRTVVREATAAIVWASLAFAALALCQWLLAGIPPLPALYLTIVTLSLTAATVAVLWRSGVFGLAQTVRSRLLLVAGTVAVAALLSLPGTLAQYVLWVRDTATLDTTVLAGSQGLASVVMDFARNVSPLCAPVFGGLLVLGARQISDLGITPARLAQVLFACYVVDSNGVFIVLIPIVFLLAWPTFRFIVSPSPTWREPWKGGIGAMPLGFAVGAVNAVLAVLLSADRLATMHTAFQVLGVLGILVGPATWPVFGAFAFGGYYDALRGRTRVEKSLTVAGWAALCSIPAWFLWYVHPIATMVFLAFEMLAFFTLVGLRVTPRDARQTEFAASQI